MFWVSDPCLCYPSYFQFRLPRYSSIPSETIRFTFFNLLPRAALRPSRPLVPFSPSSVSRPFRHPSPPLPSSVTAAV